MAVSFSLFPRSGKKRVVSTAPTPTDQNNTDAANMAPKSTVPETGHEWKVALTEVKKMYLDRKYQSCAGRCHELLRGAKQCKSIEPVYIIYLHFYAASSLEMQVRSLHAASPHRVDMLARARDHYRRASILSDVEGQTAAGLISAAQSSQTTSTAAAPSAPAAAPALSSPPRSAIPFHLPRCFSPSAVPRHSHSPSLSVDTVVTTASSSSSISSASSVSSVSSISRSKSTTTRSSMPTPLVRPDSPTLGAFDEPVKSPEPTPMPASAPVERTCFYDSEDDSEDESDVETAQPEQQQQQQHQLQKQPDDTARHRSLHRFALALEGLHRQINMVHMPAVDAPPVPEPAPISPGGPNHLKGRIQRLRAVGWARKRFDPSRYEALREEAMMDLLK